MTHETEEKPIAQAEPTKKKSPAAAARCKETIAATRESGPKRTIIAMGCTVTLLFAVCLSGCGKKENPQRELRDSPPKQQAEGQTEKPQADAIAFLARQVAEAQKEMQRQQAEIQAKIAAENAAREAEAEKRRAEEEARRKEAAAENEAYWKEFREEMIASGEEFRRRAAEAQAQAEATRAAREQRLAEMEARQKEIAAQNAARVKANQEKAQARKQAMEDARNHVPTDTGELSASALSEQDFSQVFIGDAPDDEGTVYAHGRSENIRVYQSTSSGLLVGYAQGTSQYAAQVENLMGSLGVSFDRVVWVDTKTHLNEENRPLRAGFYVRRGMHSHVGPDGGEHVMARYIEIRDPKAVEMLKAEQKRRVEEKRIAEQEAAELADERGAYELNLPVKSLCGFKLGAPPSQVKPLLLHEDGTPVRVMSYGTDMMGNLKKFRMAKPFRLFTHVEVGFADHGVGKHLESVELRGTPDLKKFTRESYFAEVEATARLIERKFGIQFARSAYSTGEQMYSWRDNAGKEMLNITASPKYLSMYFADLFEIRRLDKAAQEASKTSIQFDADAGADQL
jgi:hypothetical protein